MPNQTWDDWNEQGGPKYPHEKVIQFCFRKYAPEQRAKTRVLDLGCGSGVHVVFLASEGFQVTGTDKSPVGIENTKRKLLSLNLSADLRVEDAAVVEFPPGSFDLVISVGVYDSAGPAVSAASVRRVRQVLKPGGRGFFMFASDRDFQTGSDNPYGLYGYTRSEVEALFAVDFAEVCLDRYITTYEGGRIEQNDWLVTVQR